MKIKNSVLYLLFIMLLVSACNKPQIRYWPPSQYGAKLKMSEENYRNGKKEGLSTWWHKNGNKQMECSYKDGKLNGSSMRWYYNGNPERIDSFVNDVIEGRAKTFFNEGGIESELEYKNGIPNGIYKEYWENGELKVIGGYTNGFYSGNWKHYDYTGIKTGEANFLNGDGNQIEYSLKTGAKIKETIYKKNKKEGIESWWDESGKKIKEVIYSNDNIINTIVY